MHLAVQRFSTAPTGGTAVSDTGNISKYDSTSAANTISLAQHYSVAPTAGTSAGFPATFRGFVPSATVSGQWQKVWDFGNRSAASALVLRGTGEGIGFQFDAAVTYDIEIEWTEE
jgi:hypothetical protein